MAKQSGGLLGRPSGSIAGIVFGSARSRQGKIVTAREKVSPSNPNTASQQTQRGKFGNALSTVKAIGPSIYQDDWNRAVSQLPGFQSWMSLVLNNLDASSVLSAPADVNLGNLHFPSTGPTLSAGGAGEITVEWSNELGDNGTAADVAVLVGINADLARVGGPQVVIKTDVTRTDETNDLAGFDSGATVIVLLYFQGAGTADGLLSLAKFDSGTAGS
jgi:hypothetical protein